MEDVHVSFVFYYFSKHRERVILGEMILFLPLTLLEMSVLGDVCPVARYELCLSYSSLSQVLPALLPTDACTKAAIPDEC